MIVVCDQYDWEDYPAFIASDENIHDRISYFRHSPMQMVMEVYDLRQDRDEQLNEERSFRHPPFPKDYRYEVTLND